MTCRYSYSFCLLVAHHFYSFQFLLWFSLLSPHCSYFTLHSECNPSSFKSIQQLAKEKKIILQTSLFIITYSNLGTDSTQSNSALLSRFIHLLYSFFTSGKCNLFPVSNQYMIIITSFFYVSSSTQIVLPHLLCVNFRVV